MSHLGWTTRPRGPNLRVPVCGLSTLAVAAGLAVAAFPASPGSRLSDAAKQALKPPAEQRPLAGNDKEPTLVVVPSVAIEIAAPSPAPYPKLYPQPYPWPYPSPYPPGPYPEPHGEPYAEPYYGDLGPPAWSPFQDLHVGTVVAIGSLSSPDFAPSTLYGLRVGSSDSRRTVLDLVLLAGSAGFADGTDIANALRHAREVGLEGSMRYSITPRYAALGIAPVAGFRISRLAWRYLNEIQIESEGLLRDVRDDSIWHYSPYLGVALTFVNTRHVDLGVAALTGWRFYGKESREGFENDLFPQDSYNELRLETSVGF